jgi:imidazoleglycerol phosphate dehydratase HisB/histidinol-phosphate/aromatic aminotransferase/cobyric acid decarboxylase-like protein
MTADLPIREDLRGKSPYGAPQLDVAVRLNTNENSYPLPDPVVDAIAKAVQAELRDLNRYPDRDAVALRTDLAGYLGHGLTAANVWAANGSNEVQQQLLQAFAGPGRTALGFGPSYSMHPLLAAGTGTRWIGALRDPDFGLTPESAVAQLRQQDPDLVFLCSPNNPTGTALDPAVVDAVLATTKGMVVVDEAYAEFARPGMASALALLPEHPRLVVTRTMSKAFGFAGGRLGYFAAGAAVVDADSGRGPRRAGAPGRAAGHGGRDQTAARPDRLGAARSWRPGRRQRRELRVVPGRRRSANRLEGAAGPGSPGARRRPARLAAGHRRHSRRDRRIPFVRRGDPVSRTGRIERVTNETKVLVEIDLDGTGKGDLATGVGFYDHMLNQLAKHGGFDLTVRTEGDLEIDAHHTMEDTAIALGEAFARALGDKAGIRRYGSATIPMDEVLCRAAVDLSGRPYVVHDEPELAPYIGPVYPTSMTRHIFESFGLAAKVTLHVTVLRAARDGGRPDAHHVVEAQFKAFSRALREAVEIDPRNAGALPSTKGVL